MHRSRAARGLMSRTLALCAAAAGLSVGASAQAEPYVARVVSDTRNSTGPWHMELPMHINQEGWVCGYDLSQARGLWWSARATPYWDGGLTPRPKAADPRPERGFSGVNTSSQWLGTDSFEGDSWKAPRHATIWIGGNSLIRVAEPQGAAQTTGSDINEGGVVVGAALTAMRPDEIMCDYTGYVARPGEPALRLPLLEGYSSARAEGLNDQGVIVGTATIGSEVYAAMGSYEEFQRIPSNGQRAVIWRGERIDDLNRLLISRDGWQIGSAKDINNRGQIVVTAARQDAFGWVGATLVLVPAGADFNDDGEVTPDDLFAFQQAHGAGRPTADYTGNGVVNADDLAAFTALWQTGTRAGGDGTPLTPQERSQRVIGTTFVSLPGGVPRPAPPGQPIYQVAPCSELPTFGPGDPEGTDVNAKSTWCNRAECWNSYHKNFNPQCNGCDAVGNPTNPGRRDGYPGWDTQDPAHPTRACNPGFTGPIAGGPGGRGRDADATNPGGNGGKGGNGANGGPGGAGGGGGNASPTQPPGKGGDGGVGNTGGTGGEGGDGNGTQPGGNGGKGGNGDTGGTGGQSGKTGSDPKNPGGEGGTGGNGTNGPGGTGGKGGDAPNPSHNPGGKGGGGGDSAPGFPGGTGGEGGKGNGAGTGGQGGPGGQGGSGSTPNGDGSTGKQGGTGGKGGDGGQEGSGGDGGSGGKGGTGSNGVTLPDGNGGKGGTGGQGGTKPRGAPPTAKPGAGGRGGPGGNGTRPGSNGGEGGTGGQGGVPLGGGGAGGTGGSGKDPGTNGSPGGPGERGPGY